MSTRYEDLIDIIIESDEMAADIFLTAVDDPDFYIPDKIIDYLEDKGIKAGIIYDAINCEMVNVVRRTLNSLLIKKNNKEKKYIEIKESMVIEEHTKDIYLNSIYVAGTDYVDISEAYNKLTEGSILYLRREPNNPYDSNAILISTLDGCVIGYVPKESNLLF